MKKTIIQLLIFIMIVLLSCKKDKVQDLKPKIADIEFLMFDFKVPQDSTTTDINNTNTFILKGDYTWVLDFNGAKSYGKYSWKPTEIYRAQIKFEIQQWSALNSNINLSNKIKTVLETVTNCAFPGPDIIGLYLFNDNLTTTLRSSKK
jgi:hypothetical protein